VTTIASELDPEEEHHKEKSPWDMSATDDDEETYQTEGKLLGSMLHNCIVLTSPRNSARMDRKDKAAPQARSRSYSRLDFQPRRVRWVVQDRRTI